MNILLISGHGANDCGAVGYGVEREETRRVTNRLAELLKPYMNVVILPVLSLGIRAMQIILLKKMTSFEFSTFCKRSLIPSLRTLLLASIPLIGVRFFIGHTILETILLTIIAVVWTVVSVILVGISKDERKTIIGFIRTIRSKSNE